MSSISFNTRDMDKSETVLFKPHFLLSSQLATPCTISSISLNARDGLTQKLYFFNLIFPTSLLIYDNLSIIYYQSEFTNGSLPFLWPYLHTNASNLMHTNVMHLFVCFAWDCEFLHLFDTGTLTLVLWNCNWLVIYDTRLISCTLRCWCRLKFQRLNSFHRNLKCK